jgi:small subunit ribosomal protein S6
MTQVLPKERAREYESIFILHPDSQSNVIDTIAGRCQDIITKLNGKLLRAENWGRRKLAYPVKKNQKGVYIYLKYLGYQDLVHELERNFRTIDSIIKFLSVKIDEDVNPEARPVNESDISFVSTFVEPDDHSAAEVETEAEVEAETETETEDVAAEAAADDAAEVVEDASADADTADEAAAADTAEATEDENAEKDSADDDSDEEKEE